MKHGAPVIRIFAGIAHKIEKDLPNLRLVAHEQRRQVGEDGAFQVIPFYLA
jgi:hypothetical protein